MHARSTRGSRLGLLLLAASCASEAPSPPIDSGVPDGGNVDGAMDGDASDSSVDSEPSPGDGACGRRETLLNDNTAWHVLTSDEAAEDPYEGRPTDVLCLERAIKNGPVGQPLCEDDPYDVSFEVESEFCGWMTARQNTLADVRAGDTLRLRLFHFALTAGVSRPAESRMSLRMGDDVVWELRKTIPSPSQLINDTWVAENDYPAGTTLHYHVDNHGNNDYLLFEIVRVDD